MTLLWWAIIALVVALVAGALGFTGVAGAAATISRVLFGIFLVIFLAIVIMMILGIGALTSRSVCDAQNARLPSHHRHLSASVALRPWRRGDTNRGQTGMSVLRACHCCWCVAFGPERVFLAMRTACSKQWNTRAIDSACVKLTHSPESGDRRECLSSWCVGRTSVFRRCALLVPSSGTPAQLTVLVSS